MKFLISILSVIFMTSCASLTQQQVKEVETFSKLTNAFSLEPGKTAYTVGLLDLQRYGLSKSRAQNREVGKYLNGIDGAFKFYNEYRAVYDTLDAILLVLKSYADNLGKLVSENYAKSVAENAKTIGEKLPAIVDSGNAKGLFSINSVPFGVIGPIIKYTGDGIIKKKQLKALKEFVGWGDTTIQDFALIVNRIMNSYRSELPVIKSSVIDDYKYLLTGGVLGPINDTARIKLVDERIMEDITPELLAFLKKYDETEKALGLCAKGIDQIAKTHKSLLKSVNSGQTPAEFTKDINTLLGILLEISKLSDKK